MFRIALCLIFLFVFVPRGVAANTSLTAFEQQIRDLCGKIADEADGRPVFVDDFKDRSPGSMRGKAGEGLRQSVVRFLERSSVRINEDADLVFAAQFSIGERERPGLNPLLELTLQPEFEDTATGRTIRLLPVEAPYITTDSTKVIAVTAGPTGAVPSDRDYGGQVPKDERHGRLGDITKHPTGVCHGTTMRPTSSSPYGVELLIYDSVHDKTPTFAQPVIKNGHPHVNVPVGKLYEIRIKNEDQGAVAAAAFVDGVSVFATADPEFCDPSTGKPKFERYIVESGKTSDIAGWFKRIKKPDNVLSFKVVKKGEGLASRTGIKAVGGTGAIHLQFSHCRPIKPGAKGRGNRETDTGPPKSRDLKPVNYEVDVPHAFLTIRYDRD